MLTIPLALYGATKKANELLAHSRSHLFGLPTTGLRFFTVYGPWGRPDMALFKFTDAILNGSPIDCTIMAKWSVILPILMMLWKDCAAGLQAGSAVI